MIFLSKQSCPNATFKCRKAYDFCLETPKILRERENDVAQ